MALIRCNECGQMISDQARVCPKCGKPLFMVQQPNYYPEAHPTNKGKSYTWLYVLIGALAVVAIVLVVLLANTCGTKKHSSPTPTTVEQQAQPATPAPPAQTSQIEPKLDANSSLRSGVIVDPVDDYVNVRSGKGTKYSVLQRLDVGTIVLYEPGHKWVKVYDTNKSFLGYVYHDRIK